MLLVPDIMGDFMGVMSIQEGLTRARGSLSAAEAARLQYNKEFQALVSSASASATELKASMELLPGIGESETFLPQVTGVLATLGTFGYSGEAAAAPF